MPLHQLERERGMCLMNLVSFSLKTRAPDHILDDERSPLRELDLLVEQQWAVGGRVASPANTMLPRYHRLGRLRSMPPELDRYTHATPLGKSQLVIRKTFPGKSRSSLRPCAQRAIGWLHLCLRTASFFFICDTARGGFQVQKGGYRVT